MAHPSAAIPLTIRICIPPPWSNSSSRNPLPVECASESGRGERTSRLDQMALEPRIYLRWPRLPADARLVDRGHVVQVSRSRFQTVRIRSCGRLRKHHQELVHLPVEPVAEPARSAMGMTGPTSKPAGFSPVYGSPSPARWTRTTVSKNQRSATSWAAPPTALATMA